MYLLSFNCDFFQMGTVEWTQFNMGNPGLKLSGYRFLPPLAQLGIKTLGGNLFTDEDFLVPQQGYLANFPEYEPIPGGSGPVLCQ